MKLKNVTFVHDVRIPGTGKTEHFVNSGTIDLSHRDGLIWLGPVHFVPMTNVKCVEIEEPAKKGKGE